MKKSRITYQALLCVSSCLTAALFSTAAQADNPTPTFNKIVLVIEENQSYGTIIGNPSAPYTNFLANNGALFTKSYGVEHPSQPNYLDIFSAL